MMQLTYDDVGHLTDDELAPEQTRDIPFFGFVTGTIISFMLWGAIAWTLWAALT